MKCITIMNTEKIALIKSSIKSIPDYPKAGILFRDVTSLMEDPAAYKATIELLVDTYKDMGFTKVVGTEARGFLFGAPLALELGVGFVPGFVSQASYHVKLWHNRMSLSTVQILLRSILMRSLKAIKC